MIRSPSEELRYGSFLVYAPRPQTEVEAAAKNYVVKRYKQDKVLWTDPATLATEYLVLRLAEEMKAGRATPLASFFSPKAVLVPIPRHAPGGLDSEPRDEVVWAPLSLAAALALNGMGHSVELLLSRRTPVRKSAGAASRPSPREHYESLAVTEQVPVGPLSRILLVDDIITRGSTFLGAARRLREAFPEATISAFAGVRTMSEGFGTEMKQPVVGNITLDRGRLVRNP